MTSRHVLAAVVLLVVTLTSCTDGETPAVSPSATVTATTSTADIAYLAAIRPQVQGSTDADLVALGHEACDDLTDDDPLTVAGHLEGRGFTTAASAAITTAAITAYCPAHSSELATP